MIKQRLILHSYATYSTHFGVPVGTLRYWAHQDGWRPYGTPRDRRWSMLEVQASYDRRHTKGQQACA